MVFARKKTEVKDSNLVKQCYMIEVKKKCKSTTMSAFNCKNQLKRLPFTDKTNLISRENFTTTLYNSTLPQKSLLDSYAKIDPKFKLFPKVHLQCCSIINKKLSSSSNHVQSQKVSNKEIILNDLKFGLIPKVHLQRMDINDKMPNLPTAKGEVGKISNKKSRYVDINNYKLVSNGSKAVNLANKELLQSEKNIPNSCKPKNITLDHKYYRQLVVRVTRDNELEAALKDNVKSQNVKKVQFTHGVNCTPKFDKALRKRRTRNYAEISFKDSLSPKENLEENYKERVPVYLQSTTNQQKQWKKDPFEFVPDSPVKANKKKRRGRPMKQILSPLQFKKRNVGRPTKESGSDSDSSLYDKSMHEVLKKVRLKVSPKKLKYVRRTKQNNNKVKIVTNQIKTGQLQIAPKVNCWTNDSNVIVTAGPSNIQKQVTRKSREHEVLTKNTSGVKKTGATKDLGNRSKLMLLTQEIQKVRRRISTVSCQNIEDEQKKNDFDNYFGFDDDCDDDYNDISRVLPVQQNSIGRTTLNPIPVLQRFTSLTSTPLPNSQMRSPKITQRKNQTNSKRISVISNILVCSPGFTEIQTNTALPPVVESSTIDTSCVGSLIEKDEDFFGFDNSHLQPSTSAGVVSKTVHNSETYLTIENDFRGFENVNNGLSNINTYRRGSKKTSHPWRGNHLQLKRNPHFLTMKDTSLPCYNQEMILEPKLLEMPRTSIPHNKTPNKKKQKSMLDYVNSNKINNQSTPTKKNQNMSLFDEADFSPIKDKNIQENLSPDKNSEDKLQTPKGKRNIFGSNRSKNEISPLKERNREDTFGVENYFGFDTPEHRRVKGKENVRITRNRAKYENKLNEEALPMRVPMKQLKKIREEAVEELFDEINVEDIAEKPVVEEVVEHLSNEKSQEEDVPHVGLFEDLVDVRPPPRIYVRKRAKRTRAVSVSSDTEEIEKPKRKRKDILTSAEEAEFNKWATAFNAMCSEIEKHDLTLN